MPPPNPLARDQDGGAGLGAGLPTGSGAGVGAGAGSGSGKGPSTGSKASSVPGRIGRPPQWTGTRSRKLARLYMYTTLSVDKILKVLEDDVFKPRKNSAQKTIHNMLDHDPRYLRPESREDMNQRLKLLSASSERSRKSWRKHDEANQGVAQQQQQHAHLPSMHQQIQHPLQQPMQPPIQQSIQQPPLPSSLTHSSGYDDVLLHHGIKHELEHSTGLSYLSQQQQQQPQQHQQHQQHPQHHHQPQPQQPQQHHQHHQHVQHPQQHLQHYQQPHQVHQPQQHLQQPAFLPPPPTAAPAFNQQAYNDYYYPQYQQAPQQQQQQQHQQHQQHQQQHHPHQLPLPHQHPHQHHQNQQQQSPLSMQQMAYGIPPVIGDTGWTGVYEQHQSQRSTSHQQAADPSVSRLGMGGGAPYDYLQQAAGMSAATLQAPPQAAQHQHHPHQQLYHASGQAASSSASFDVHEQHHLSDPSELPLYATQQRPRRMSSAAYSADSDASTDVSTETIEDLKHRLSGCSTHYANQVADLLRKFTISSGSDSRPSPVPSYSGDPGSSSGNDNYNTDPHRIRKIWRQRQQRVRSASVGGSSSSGNSSSCGSFGVYDSDVDVYGEASISGGGGGLDDDEMARQGPSSSHGSNTGSNISSAASPEARGDDEGFHGRQRRRTVTAATTAIGRAANTRLALPGDFFNAYQYRDDANCPFHSKQRRRRRADEEDQSNRRGNRRRANHKGEREHRCWCAIADAVAAVAGDIQTRNAGGSDPFWVLADGRLTPGVEAMLHEQPPQQRHQLAIRRDIFGHSLLHLFASREGQQMQLLTMILNCDDATVAATNSAGQTFLHLLTPGWFVALHDPYAPLRQLLAHLQSRIGQGVGSSAASSSMALPHPGNDLGRDDASNPAQVAVARLVYATDVYGRSFFHRLAAFVDERNLATVRSLVQHYEHVAFARRDALANNPMDIFGGVSSNAMMQGGVGISASAILKGGNVPMVFASEDAFIRHHESLLRIVTASDNQTGVEDPEGRNGLHCLAEAIVDKRMMDEHRNALSSGRKLPKKKAFDKKDASTGNSASGAASTAVGPPTPSSSSYNSTSPYFTAGASPATVAAMTATTPTTATDLSSTRSLLHLSTDGAAQMATRLRLVQGLLSPPLVVDVDHYDRRGQTVLTSFVVHIADDQEDKAKSLVAIFETLLAAGARIEGRNRRGETALLVAARLGRKIALTTLLDHGANVHARDAAGRGVLDVLDMQCRRQARRDVALYGRLEACRVLLTGIKQLSLGVKQRPTLLDEWTVVHRRGPEPRDMQMTM